MTCSCSKPNVLETEKETERETEIVLPPVADIPTNVYLSNGSVAIGSSNDIFVDLAYSLPFGASAADSYITSYLSKQFLLNFEPTYFQIPFIYSATDNLINGNYTKTVKLEDTKVITTYVIPYKKELELAEVTITTILDTITNILFYEIPREFTYNSKDQASVAVTPKGIEFVGKLLIPSSFITVANVELEKFGLTFNILPGLIKSEINPNAVTSGLTGTAVISLKGSCCGAKLCPPDSDC